MTDYRNRAMQLIEEQLVDPEFLALCAIKYMSQDDVRDMLESNELVDFDQDPSFEEDLEPEVDYLTELYDAFGEDC